MVPASMFMYGSILMAVTFKPAVLRRRPVLDAKSISAAYAVKQGQRTDDTLSDTGDDTTADDNVLDHLGKAERE
jgi:hypothetical protein